MSQNIIPTPSSEKQTSYRYVPVHQVLTNEDIGTYSTFGLQVLLVEEILLEEITDISTDLCEVQRIAELCTERQLHPEQIHDVVHDLLHDPDPIFS